MLGKVPSLLILPIMTCMSFCRWAECSSWHFVEPFRQLNYYDIAKMGLLDAEELPSPSLLEMRSAKNRVCEGIIGDFDNDGIDEAVIAGMMEGPQFYDVEKANCYLKIMRARRNGTGFDEIAKHDISNEWDFYDGMGAHVLSGGNNGVHVTFRTYASNYAASMTVLVCYSQGKFSFYEAKHDVVPIEFVDMDKDGVTEVVVTRLVDSFPLNMVLWSDIYKWDCTGLTLADSLFPEFFAERMHGYEEKVRNPPVDAIGSGRMLEMYVEVNKLLIERASKYVKQVKK